MSSRWWFVALLAVTACTDPRKLVLTIDTSAGIPCEIDRIQIRARAAGSTTYEHSLDGERLPLRVTLLDDTPSGMFDLEVTGLKGDTEVMRAKGPLQFGDRDMTQPVLLDQGCMPEQPCGLPDVTSADAPPLPSLAHFQCGPTTRAYAPAANSDGLVNACNSVAPVHGSVFTAGATGPVQVPALNSALGSFGFHFYGLPVHQIWIDKNGYVSFGRDNPDPNHDLIPGAFDRGILRTGPPPPRQSIMAFWDTLFLGTGSAVCYALEAGQAGTQTLRITWQQLCLTQTCAGDNLNFEIALDESNDGIVVSYGTMVASNPDRARGITATMGLVNDAVGCPVEQCTLSTGRCADGVTPCGYSQVFSNMLQPGGVKNAQFFPVVEP